MLKIIILRPSVQDLRAAIDHIHWDSTELKSRTLADLPRYVRRDERLPHLLASLKQDGRKVFLLTNRDRYKQIYSIGHLRLNQNQLIKLFFSFLYCYSNVINAIG